MGDLEPKRRDLVDAIRFVRLHQNMEPVYRQDMIQAICQLSDEEDRLSEAQAERRFQEAIHK